MGAILGSGRRAVKGARFAVPLYCVAMEMDIGTVSPGRAYRMLISVIVPRPIAWVSSLDAAGRRNLAPFSFFMGVGSHPLTLAISVIRRQGALKDTAANILETKEFVVNSSTQELAERVNQSSGDYAHGLDEFELTGLTPAPSVRVRPPRVAESPVSLECRLHSFLVVGEEPNAAHLLVGEVMYAHIRDDLFEDAMVNAERLHPIARLGANLYATLGRVFAQDRPRVDADGRAQEDG